MKSLRFALVLIPILFTIYGHQSVAQTTLTQQQCTDYISKLVPNGFIPDVKEAPESPIQIWTWHLSTGNYVRHIWVLAGYTKDYCYPPSQK